MQLLADVELGAITLEERHEWLDRYGLDLGIYQRFARLLLVLAALLPGTPDLLIPVPSAVPWRYYPAVTCARFQIFRCLASLIRHGGLSRSKRTGI